MARDPYTIIPLQGFPLERGSELDHHAICDWLSIGFFLENDTFWKDVKWNGLDYSNQPWRYEPRGIDLQTAVDEFADLFHTIIKEHTEGRHPLLALSGGLDSRTLAAGVKYLGLKPPITYSYKFQNSFEESSYGRKIAKALNWEFLDLEIPSGYLWSHIKDAAAVNHCYAEFTHPRQVAVLDELSTKGDQFLLGHLGDLIFDDMGISEDASLEKQHSKLERSLIKQGGFELANELYQHWGLEGDYKKELSGRIEAMYEGIHIANVNAKMRAFKSLYWVPRWTNTNLSFFMEKLPVSLPYYDDRMCQFIMTIPEELLAGRQIQIEYLKKYAPELARIPWQGRAPYNLYDHHKFKTRAHLPYRILNRLKRDMNEKVLGKQLVQRNWEIQFQGAQNEKELESWLFENPAFSDLVPEQITRKYYDLFRKADALKYSHAISMLLTLSVFTSNESAA